LTPPASPTVRLFVALDLPDVLRGHLLGWSAHALSDIPGVRLQRPEAMHVTLCFLGDQPIGEVEAIAGAMRAAVGRMRGAGARRSAIRLTPGAAIWLPARRPRVAAVEMADAAGELPALQADVSAALVDGGWYEPEHRTFRAHVTVARIGRNGPRQPPELPVSPPVVSATVGSVSLYRSHTGPSGARYEAEATVELVP
jgi:RNA 2',3'-cyclic 3'-phosphodiesterase